MPPAQDEDRTTLERAEPAHQSGLDVVPNPKLSPRLTRARRADWFTFRCPSAQKEGSQTWRTFFFVAPVWISTRILSKPASEGWPQMSMYISRPATGEQ